MAIKICAAEELVPDQAIRVLVDETPIALVKDGSGACHAIGDTCSHAEIPLSEGFFEGTSVECWAHGARFDLIAGRALSLPATEPIPVYGVSIVDGDVYIDMDVQLEEAG